MPNINPLLKENLIDNIGKEYQRTGMLHRTSKTSFFQENTNISSGEQKDLLMNLSYLCMNKSRYMGQCMCDNSEKNFRHRMCNSKMTKQPNPRN